MARFGIVRSARLSSTPTMIAGPSAQRVALLFSSPTIPGTSYTVSTDAAVTLGGGINLSVGATPIEVSMSSFGDAPQKPWYGVSSAGLATISGLGLAVVAPAGTTPLFAPFAKWVEVEADLE